MTTPWAAAGVAKAAMRAAKATYLFMRSHSYFRNNTRRLAHKEACVWETRPFVTVEQLTRIREFPQVP
jgi:hypothetical protein